MMREKQITAYFCSHCNKLYQRKHACIDHEKICANNPETKRACFLCCHFEKKDTIVYNDSYCGEKERKLSLLHCKKLDKFLYPPKVEAKKNWFDLEDELNEAMPKVCNDMELWNY